MCRCVVFSARRIRRSTCLGLGLDACCAGSVRQPRTDRNPNSNQQSLESQGTPQRSSGTAVRVRWAGVLFFSFQMWLSRNKTIIDNTTRAASSQMQIPLLPLINSTGLQGTSHTGGARGPPSYFHATSTSVAAAGPDKRLGRRRTATGQYRPDGHHRQLSESTFRTT